ncbi:MAG: hypothetical protein KAR35_09545, partial [Candidatus Heimdallarchaeota archaeon]|nr:hypothetical protein [Candidatus Heimdallarchaeota archaeon]MCK5049600.1 hypothetical protein [Candidatus Heimdallarchaeota archaeon]
ELDETLEIEIILSKHLYETQTVSFSIDMIPAEAEIDVIAPETIVYSTEALEIEINITAYGIEIPTGINFDNYNSTNAPILIASDVSMFTIELTLEATDAGYILVITISPTSPLLEGSYQIIIEIIPRATDYTSESPDDLYYFEEGNITITFSDGLVNETLELYQWTAVAEGNELSFMIAQSRITEDGRLIIIFYANDTVQFNQLNITITLYLVGYETQVFVITVDIKLIVLDVEVVISGEVTPGSSFTIVLTVSLENESEFSLLALNLNEFNINYSEVDAYIELTFTLKNGSIRLYNETFEFNDEGIASLTITVPSETKSLESEIAMAGVGLSGFVFEPTLNFIPAENGGTTGVPTELVIAAIGIIIGIIVLILLIRYIYNIKIGKKKAEINLLAHIEEIKTIQTLIIGDRRTGLSVFNYDFKEMSIDPQLVTGLLQAYGAFDKELSSEDRDIPEGYYVIPLGTNYINRVVTSDFDVYLISSGPAPSLEHGFKKFSEWFSDYYKGISSSLSAEVAFFDGFEEEKLRIIVRKLNIELDLWLNTGIVPSVRIDINKIKKSSRAIANFIFDAYLIGTQRGVQFTEIWEEFDDYTLVELYQKIKELYHRKELIIQDG